MLYYFSVLQMVTLLRRMHSFGNHDLFSLFRRRLSTESKSLIRELRHLTSASLNDVMKSVQTCGIDKDECINWLIKNGGTSVRSRRTDCKSRHGLLLCGSLPKYGWMMEINSETDFAARSSLFQSALQNVTEYLSSHEWKFDQQDISQEGIITDLNTYLAKYHKFLGPHFEHLSTRLKERVIMSHFQILHEGLPVISVTGGYARLPENVVFNKKYSHVAEVGKHTAVGFYVHSLNGFLPSGMGHMASVVLLRGNDTNCEKFNESARYIAQHRVATIGMYGADMKDPESNNDQAANIALCNQKYMGADNMVQDWLNDRHPAGVTIHTSVLRALASK